MDLQNVFVQWIWIRIINYTAEMVDFKLKNVLSETKCKKKKIRHGKLEIMFTKKHFNKIYPDS